VLEAAVVRAVDAFQRQVGGEAIAINARHAGALAEARSRLRAVLAQLQSSGAVELLASDMRGALDALGEISGRVDNERMLDRLFSTFCIGK
jgi:tRNA modification GTPase